MMSKNRIFQTRKTFKTMRARHRIESVRFNNSHQLRRNNQSHFRIPRSQRKKDIQCLVVCSLLPVKSRVDSNGHNQIAKETRVGNSNPRMLASNRSARFSIAAKNRCAPIISSITFIKQQLIQYFFRHLLNSFLLPFPIKTTISHYN